MSERKLYSLIFFLAAALFYIPFLGGVHLFDWDEINFAEISREMLILKDYLRIYVNFDPFWEKPPFFFWMQSLAMHFFGINEFAARLPNAICGIITLPLLFNLGKTLFNTRFGILWAIAYGGSVLPFLYFKSGIIDPWFNFFIFLGMYFFTRFYWVHNNSAPAHLQKNKWLLLLISGIFVGLGILTKGPVAYLIPILCMGVYWIYKRFRFYINPLHFIYFTIASSLIMLSWYGLETWKNGYWFVHEFNKYQFRLFSTPDAGHAGFPGYHFVVLLFGVFPASIFCVCAFFKTPASESQYQDDFKIWMCILFWVVLILFTIVKSKIVHYSSMCYFPISFLAAFVMDKILDQKIQFSKLMKGLLIFIAGIYILATIAVPILGQNIEVLKPLFQKDPFALANLDAEVNWTIWHIIPGIFLLIVMIVFFKMQQSANLYKSFIFIYISTSIFVMLTLIFDINNIEMYSQRAAIDFYKSKATEDCYIHTHGFKSYGHLFYAQKRNTAHPNSNDKNWLLNEQSDKPVYVVCKINKADELKANPNLQELYRKNGFVFFKKGIRE